MTKKEGEIDKKAIVQETLEQVKETLANDNYDEATLYHSVKDFLKKYIEADYEFTNKEIKKELERTYLNEEIKNDLINLVEKISIIEYSDEPLDENEAQKIMLYFYYILKRIHEQHKPKKGIFKRIKRIFTKS